VVSADADLTRTGRGEPLGERIIVTGRLLDETGRPLDGALVEIWQANAAGRYAHEADDHPAPLDPHFRGTGRCVTDAGGGYRFTTIRPGAYPWGNHPNAWRPAHVHFSVLGRSLSQRLVTQMYFPGDPLLDHDPITASVPDPAARGRLVARWSEEVTEPDWALGYVFDIALGETPSQTVGPFFAIALPWAGTAEVVPPGTPGAVRLRGRVLDGAGRPVTDALIETWQTDPAGGFAQCATDAGGGFAIVTHKPARGGIEAPHLDVSLFARGLLRRLVTRAYFPDEAVANGSDPVLRSIADPAARATLVAVPEDGGLRFDIHLQGDDETVFLEL
jgi:protocatechuate 3,4-dioxygenase beta subunit